MRCVRVLIPACLLLTAVVAGCGDDPENSDSDIASVDLDGIETLRPQITAFCGGCHAVPDPAAFPKDEWYHEVEKAYGFFRDSGRADLQPPPMTDVVRWFRDQAPDELVLQTSESTPSPIGFRQESIDYEQSVSEPPAISGVFVFSAPDRRMFCDMRNGFLGMFDPGQSVTATRSSDVAAHPARVERSDLDGDGVADYLIAELGSYQPGDHSKGRLVWYRPDAAADNQTLTLLDGLGRIADARPADFDGDGDQDLVVAEFGWIKTGSVHVLEQIGQTNGVPQFDRRVIDKRHGAIHVPVADLDGDGDADFVALISQEYEEIAAFLNRGDGSFERQIILSGSDPAFGSSGIELVDLDADGDLDVLYVNGDSLDSDLLKPYHGVRWLENEGTFPFRLHVIGLVPGACRAVPGDLDADGDLDIVVGAWVPPDNAVSSPDSDSQFDTLLWFEQTASGQYRRHSVTRAAAFGYMSAELADLDDDGDLDIAAGHFGRKTDNNASGLHLFWNLTAE